MPKGIHLQAPLLFLTAPPAPLRPADQSRQPNARALRGRPIGEAGRAAQGRSSWASNRFRIAATISWVAVGIIVAERPASDVSAYPQAIFEPWID